MRSIRSKLALLVVSTVVSAVLVMCVAATWHDAVRQFSLKQAELRGIAAVIAASVAVPLATDDHPNVARTLSAAGRIPGLTFAGVTDLNDQPVQQFGFGVVVGRETGRLEANPQIGPFSGFYLATYPVAVPIISGGKPIGTLRLIADLSMLRSALLESFVVALLAGAVAVAVGLALAQRLQAGIVRPVTDLTAAIVELGRNRDFTRQVKKSSNDEVGFLVGAFNGMIGEVRTRDEALVRHRDRLEIEVKERTAELSGAKLMAESANAAKSEFLATMSHEIRTPLNGMLVMAELMASGNLAPRFQRYADVLLSSGQTLLAIINDVLDLSKIEAGKLELESVPVHVAGIVDNALALYGERARAKGLDLAGYVEPNVAAAIAADPVRLSQIVSNLVNNALKFTEKGSVSIRVSAGADSAAGAQLLRFEVIDTGIGIAADKLGSIFDSFSQADQSTTRRFGGTGIGLTICQRLVKAMGGGISVASRPGEGSVFRVELEAAVLEAARAIAQAPPGEPSTVVIALQVSPTCERLCGYARTRGLTPVVCAPAQLAAMNMGGVRAIIASPLHLRTLAGSRGVAHERPLQEPLLIGIAGLGDNDGSGALDGLLELPLGCDAAAACFDGIVRGRAAGSAGVAAEVPSGALPLPPSSIAGARVLAADDSAVNREVLIEVLRQLDVQVICAEDGAAAVELVKTQRFDLVLMDCSMPVMDGFAATRAIREFERATGGTALPVIALTAHVLGGAADAWRDAGMSGYLTKPFTLKSLRLCLEQALHGREGAGSSPAAEASNGDGARGGLPGWPLLDPEVLTSIASMQRPGDDLVARIVKLYDVHSPKALARVLEARLGGAPQQLADAAHALRSMSRNVGAVRVAELCGMVEEAARRGDPALPEETFEDIALSLSRTSEALEASLAKEREQRVSQPFARSANA